MATTDEVIIGGMDTVDSRSHLPPTRNSGGEVRKVTIDLYPHSSNTFQQA